MLGLNLGRSRLRQMAVRLGVHFFAIMRLSFRRTEARSKLNSGEGPRAQREKEHRDPRQHGGIGRSGEMSGADEGAAQAVDPVRQRVHRVTAASGAGRFDSG